MTEAAERVAAVLPALNESASIDAVVRGLLPFASVIVVDDGSADRTGELAHAAGAEVVRHPVNRGYDRSLETGLLHAIRLGFQYAVTMDADGQHGAAAIQSFVAELRRGADLVIGIRDRRQRLSESLFALVAARLWGIRDPLCGMKGYRLSRLHSAGPLSTYSSIGTELAIRAARSDCRIAQVPIVTRDRVDASRFGSGLRANWRILKAMGVGLARARALPG